MLFNSFAFAIFLPAVFLIYWFAIPGKLQFRNLFLLLASYVFYAFWDYRFLLLLLFSTWLDFFTGIKIFESSIKSQKKKWLLISIITNLGFLGTFKYYNFFITSLSESLLSLGITFQPTLLQIILPVGISFYTFHGLSYILDIYNSKIRPETNFITYGLFVCYFPLLVAGPIERATHLLPQLKKNRSFNYTQAVNGLKQIIWGLFKKVVVADNCAIYVDTVYAQYTQASPDQLVTAVLLFAFQIYGDFSGYSDMALGISKLFGIDLIRNFKFPYFSRSMAEFWRRWHISLSSWFRDYVYIPLGGSHVTKYKEVRNVFIIFILSGFWHGANWTFITWGLLNAIFIMPSIIFSTNRQNLEIVASNTYIPSIKELVNILLTFGLTCLAWIFFRSASLTDAIHFIGLLKNNNIGITQLSSSYARIAILILLIFEWLGRQQQIPFNNFKSANVRYSVYLFTVLLIFFMGAFINPRSFIYFQF